MCGGSPKRATITKPDYNAYNQQFELQKSAIEQSMNSGIMELQSDFQAQLRQGNASMEAIARNKAEEAQDQALISEDARRLSTLIGAPPPEKVADAPKVGSKSRDLATANGKKSLRIGSTASSSAKGTGLNIT